MLLAAGLTPFIISYLFEKECILPKYDWIVSESKLPWLTLDLEIPFREMLEEAKNVRDLFVSHRANDSGGGSSHKGWHSLCIHGVEYNKTNHFTQYGYRNNEETPYKWTKVASMCPVTTKFFKEVFPCEDYYRVRYMLLEAGGYVAPHTDANFRKLSPVNIALNNPTNCMFKMKGHKGYVPLYEGKALMLDVGNVHAVYNNSNEDRYHIIVHGKPTAEFKKLVERSYGQ